VTAPDFLRDILGLRSGVPNNADIDSETSKAIAAEMLSILGVVRVALPKEAAGTALEVGVAAYLAEALPVRDPDRTWEVERRKLITDFDQYLHLARLDELVRENPTLRTEIGRDYLIKPDVTVGVVFAEGHRPALHAAISCKWTIRSDRVQNIRHEGVILTRSRRGRQPHVVTVTAEPLPTRLAAIARGTGEVDTVYHVALDELVAATATAGTQEQKDVLDELIQQKRLADFESIVDVLTTV
jgi:NgoMIV restriction enzyme